MERELEALRTEITHLRQDLRALASRVERQEDQLRLLGQCQSSQSLSYSQALDRFEGVPFVTGPESSAWTVVQEEGETPAPDRGTPAELSWAFREQVSREIGAFLRRALSGAQRGLSGREKTRQLWSKIYLVCRDHSGALYNPVKVLTSYTATKDLCARAGEFGDSVFVGLPSIREVLIGPRRKPDAFRAGRPGGGAL